MSPSRRSSHSERRRNPRQLSLPVVIGSGSHPFPFRTRKLSLIPPMVLHGKLCGRVGRCRHYSEKPASFGSRAFALYGESATLFAQRHLTNRTWRSTRDHHARTRLEGLG